MPSPDSGHPTTRARVARRSSPLQLVAPPRLCVVDVALSHGERGGRIRASIDARATWARATGEIEHHVIVAGAGGGAPGGRESAELRGRVAGGCRAARGVAALQATLRAVRPDVVLVHDPFWGSLAVARTARSIGAAVVGVHHGSIEPPEAAALPVPDRLRRPVLRSLTQHAQPAVDGIISAVDADPAAFEAQTAQLARIVERRRAACAEAVLLREWREGDRAPTPPRPRPTLVR